jgi:hypothetical protein
MMGWFKLDDTIQINLEQISSVHSEPEWDIEKPYDTSYRYEVDDWERDHYTTEQLKDKEDRAAATKAAYKRDLANWEDNKKLVTRHHIRMSNGDKFTSDTFPEEVRIAQRLR